MEKVDCSFLAELLDALASAVVLADESGCVFIRNRYAESMLGEVGHLAEVFSRLDISPSHRPAETGGGLPTGLPRFEKTPSMALCRGLNGVQSVRLQVLHLEGSGVVAVVLAPVETFDRAASATESHTKSDESADRAAARVAHEINNPLDGMGRFLNLAGRALGGGQVDKAIEYIDRAGDGVQRLKGVVARMLNGEGDRRGVDEAAGQIQRAVDAMTPAIAACGAALVCDIDLPDETLTDACLFPVVCNLVKNACDAMGGGGRLVLRARAEGASVILTASDSGPGIPGDAEKLFEAFYTTKAEGEGHGLGLTVSRTQAREAGGELACRNGDGGGAVFTLTLPIVRPPHRRRRLS